MAFFVMLLWHKKDKHNSYFAYTFTFIIRSYFQSNSLSELHKVLWLLTLTNSSTLMSTFSTGQPVS